MSTTIPIDTLMGWVADGNERDIMHILDYQPASLEACVLVCGLIRQGLRAALDDDDADEVDAIFAWAERVLQPHSAVRQLWCCDAVYAHEKRQGLAPEYEEAWHRARAIAASELSTN